MTAASAIDRHHPAHAIDPQTIFELRCWARAVLFFNGEFDMAEAVDPLQEYALRSGLVASVGQDKIQNLIAAAFTECRL